MKKVKGKHHLVDLHGCDPYLLNNEEFILKALAEAAAKSNSTLLSVGFHKFDPQGATGYALLAESHISIHTWPEIGHAACDIFTCGGDHVDCDAAGAYLAEAFKAEDVFTQRMERFRNAEEND